MKPILFIDFDGTLCHDRFWRNIDADSFEQIQNFLFSENKLVIQDWMKGVYSSEDINRLISKELNIPFEKIWKVFVEDCKNMTISSNTLNRIEKFRKDYTTVLITDNMDCFTRFTVPNNKGKKGARDLSYNANLGLGDLSDPDISGRMDEVEEKLISPVVARLREKFRVKVLGQLPANDVLETEDEQTRGLVKSMVSNATRGELYQYNDAKKVYGLRKKAVEIFDTETEDEEVAAA